MRAPLSLKHSCYQICHLISHHNDYWGPEQDLRGLEHILSTHGPQCNTRTSTRELPGACPQLSALINTPQSLEGRTSRAWWSTAHQSVCKGLPLLAGVHAGLCWAVFGPHTSLSRSYSHLGAWEILWTKTGDQVWTPTH